MAQTVLSLATPAAMEEIGRALAARLRVGDVITLEGGLGAGKTTLARGILRGLGFAGEAPSPTFAIVQGYDVPDTAMPIAHVDLYRIEDASELDELGLDDWLESGALVIEWPDKLGGLYDDIALAIGIVTGEDDARALTARVPKVWESRWPLT
jgi:tRNA threonylcarbamoyladenosine biosynthesis protein TsaE